FPRLGLPDWTITFVIALACIGFPLALIFAWAFELTPEGIKKSQEVDITESVTNRTGKKLNGVIITALSMALVFVLIERVFFAEAAFMENQSELADIETASIAVLPFADLSPEGDQEYFSDGLSEELLNVLAKVKDLKVAGRTSSFKFKNQNEDLKLIGEQLGVNHILEGSVRKSGDHIRITAQLISVKDGFHLWSETYDRTYNASNLFEIQDEISKQVLAELKLKLLGNEQEKLAITAIPTQDVEAYEAFLKGNQLLKNRIPKEIEEAVTYFKRATELDPTFAEAFARLAIAYARLYEYGNINREEVATLIQDNANKALFIDNSIGEAYAGLAEFYKINFDYENAQKAIKKAYELNPNNPEILVWYAILLVLDPKQSEFEMELLQKAYETDPLAPVIINNLARKYLRIDERDKAIALFDKNIENNPDFIRSYTEKIDLLRKEPFGRLDEAFIEAFKAYQKNPNNLHLIETLAISAYDFNLASLADELEAKVLALYPENTAAIGARLQKYYENKEYDEAIKLIETELKGVMPEEEYSKILFAYTLLSLVEKKAFIEAKELIEIQQPLYFSNTLTVHPLDMLLTAYVRKTFIETGDIEHADKLAELECDYYDSKLEFGGDIKKEKTPALRSYAKCSALLWDAPLVADILNELYFNRNDKYIDAHDEYSEVVYNNIRNHPKMVEVFDRIKEDNDQMKVNVIEWLKAEGEWKEEWETKN
ncbi:MAG: hypothetical protein ABJG33_16710, partial [Balneola sp.]